MIEVRIWFLLNIFTILTFFTLEKLCSGDKVRFSDNYSYHLPIFPRLFDQTIMQFWYKTIWAHGNFIMSSTACLGLVCTVHANTSKHIYMREQDNSPTEQFSNTVFETTQILIQILLGLNLLEMIKVSLNHPVTYFFLNHPIAYFPNIQSQFIKSCSSSKCQQNVAGGSIIKITRICILNLHFQKIIKYEPVHEISNNVVCATSKASDQPAHTRSLIRAFASRLSIQ